MYGRLTRPEQRWADRVYAQRVALRPSTESPAGEHLHLNMRIAYYRVCHADVVFLGLFGLPGLILVQLGDPVLVALGIPFLVVMAAGYILFFCRMRQVRTFRRALDMGGPV